MVPDAPYNDELDWVTISDFRPGIYSQSRRVLTNLSVPSPLGAAQAAGTFKCIALPSGGLAPLPAIDRTYTVPLPDTDPNAALGYFNVDGFTSFGPVGPNASTGDSDDFFLGIEYLKTGGVNRIFTLYRVDPVSGADPFPSDTLLTVTTTVSSTSESYHGMSWAISRMNPTSPFLTPGNPVVVTSWNPPAFGSNNHIVAFPNPSAPGATGISELAIPNRPTSAGETNAGDVLGHQGRIVLLEYIQNSFGGRAGDSIPTNEQISFSDPANSFNAFGTSPNFYTIGTQQQVFMQEFPNGYGAWGSISAGELFLVKHRGGGVVVSGDLASPTITRLPGVVATGGMVCRAASTPQGLFYYSRFNGMYVWRGADTSEKISPQLDDEFPFYTGGPDHLLDVTIDLQEWGTWLVTTNGYLYDTMNGGWWRLDDPSTYIPQWFSRSTNMEFLFAIPCHLNNTTKTGAIRRYNLRTPVHSYQWTSQSLSKYPGRLHELREVVIVAEGAGSIQVLVNNIDATQATQTFTLPAVAASQPVRLRLPLVANNYSLVPVILATGSGGSGSAPIVHSTAFGMRQSQPAIQA